MSCCVWNAGVIVTLNFNLPLKLRFNQMPNMFKRFMQVKQFPSMQLTRTRHAINEFGQAIGFANDDISVILKISG